jgi:hypothetical protein
MRFGQVMIGIVAGIAIALPALWILYNQHPGGIPSMTPGAGSGIETWDRDAVAQVPQADCERASGQLRGKIDGPAIKAGATPDEIKRALGRLMGQVRQDATTRTHLACLLNDARKRMTAAGELGSE